MIFFTNLIKLITIDKSIDTDVAVESEVLKAIIMERVYLPAVFDKSVKENIS